MTIKSTIIDFKTERDLILVTILSALVIVVIAFFPDSPVRILLGLPFILLFSGCMLICALFPSRNDLDLVERLALSMGISIAVTSLMGLALNYTAFGITFYSVALTVFSFMLLMSIVATYRRRTCRNEEKLIQKIGISPRRFHGAIFGVTQLSKNVLYGKSTPSADHSESINKTSLGDYFDGQKYLLISHLGRMQYPEVHSKYEK
ncbi:putative membrane protein [Candidatus Methanophagaceae archaeon]|nr:putative membrane protein [Methanophagales archaeon]